MADNLKELAISVIEKEAQAVNNLKPYINDEFLEILNLIYNSEGRLIITGIGKSAIIGQKIVATMNSTGTPAIFMHAADAPMHDALATDAPGSHGVISDPADTSQNKGFAANAEAQGEETPEIAAPHANDAAAVACKTLSIDSPFDHEGLAASDTESQSLRKESVMEKTLHVEGMMCQNCVKHVKKALEAVDGVTVANVDLDAKSAVVELSSDVSDEELIAAVVEEGYEAAMA